MRRNTFIRNAICAGTSRALIFNSLSNFHPSMKVMSQSVWCAIGWSMAGKICHHKTSENDGNGGIVTDRRKVSLQRYLLIRFPRKTPAHSVSRKLLRTSSASW